MRTLPHMKTFVLCVAFLLGCGRIELDPATGCPVLDGVLTCGTLGSLGAPCAGDADCASAICVGDDIDHPPGGHCSARCQSAADCLTDSCCVEHPIGPLCMRPGPFCATP